MEVPIHSANLSTQTQPRLFWRDPAQLIPGQQQELDL